MPFAKKAIETNIEKKIEKNLLLNAPLFVRYFTGCRNGIVAIVDINCGTGATTIVAVPAKERRKKSLKFIFDHFFLF